ncbi:hypothetical protein [Janibacter indicus]|uniref:hypothetical protein n=1 Tax=Janibacter indicus TaxID=857417 RepID=UPI003EB8F1F9
MRVLVGIVAVGIVLSGCGGGDPAVDSAPSAEPTTSAVSPTPRMVGEGATCPERLPARGLPADFEKWRGAWSGKRLVGTVRPDQLLLCRYREQGRGFVWDADKLLPSADPQEVVDDLRPVPVRPATQTVCARKAEPTPFVLVLSMPNDEVEMVRADAEPTCAYAGAETTNGVEQFVPIGNDLLETWRSGRWTGVTS